MSTNQWRSREQHFSNTRTGTLTRDIPMNLMTENNKIKHW